MHQPCQSRALGAILTLLCLAFAAACGGTKHSTQPAGTPTRPASSAEAVSTAGPATPSPAAAAGSATGTAAGAAPAAGTPGAEGCLQFSLQPISEADGTPAPKRATFDTSLWTIPNSFMPPGYTN